ncbi:BAR-domain-containing protein [Phanerochaete sordida]|uniref:BAR-domain-containing protein n=1 Tax=Phanerochaete sordida TaxID=48140 RepID=A0A9P3GJ25_9APHY|nr:BAR-domain-containing protein [Phanerochaete sordida]
MKGIGKAFARTPHLLTTKVGLSKKSNDPEFDDYQRRFATLETAAEKLLKDTKAFDEAVTNLFSSGAGFAKHFGTLFHPLTGEYDILRKYPDAEHTVKNVDQYETLMEELKSSVVPELELIQSRVMGPVKELQSIMKLIRKSITKREHKLVDYDRFNNSLTKLRDKKEKSLNDEKNLFKLEQDFEIASNEYDYINTALKTDLPRFMQMATQFIDPLFHSFFYMQLNIFYLLLEKLNAYAESAQYDVSVPPAQVAVDYETKRSDAWARIEELNVTKRIVSTSKLVQQRRQEGGTPVSSLNRASSSATTSSVGSRMPPPMRSPSATYEKKSPPPPPSFPSSAPPPYTPGPAGAGASGFAAKKAPPPPPPLKPKPRAEPEKQYVVALYDFEAQADGDLDFRAGDRIEVVERTGSTEDWWTGRINGRQGVFPGNYVQDT